MALLEMEGALSGEQRLEVVVLARELVGRTTVHLREDLSRISASRSTSEALLKIARAGPQGRRGAARRRQ